MQNESSYETYSIASPKYRPKTGVCDPGNEFSGMGATWSVYNVISAREYTSASMQMEFVEVRFLQVHIGSLGAYVIVRGVTSLN